MTQVTYRSVCFCGAILLLVVGLGIQTTKVSHRVLSEDLLSNPLWLLFSKAFEAPVQISNFMLFEKLMIGTIAGTLFATSWLFIMNKTTKNNRHE